MNKYKFSLITIMIIAAAASRFIPHPPNFSSIAAIALFGGAYFDDKKLSFVIPLLAMFLSDLYLGLHRLIPAVYASFAIIVFAGFKLREKKTPINIGLAAILGSVIFYVTTNFAVWIMSNYYSHTIDGFIKCYIAAIPFFLNSLGGDITYTVLLFGSFEFVKKYIPHIKELKIEN
jgi:hypothetical protein